MARILEPLIIEKGKGDKEKTIKINYWWSWDSTYEEDNDYDSTTRVNMKAKSDNSGCDVTVTGYANPYGNNWASVVGCNWNAVMGKTYRVTWKWKADYGDFWNVSLRFEQRSFEQQSDQNSSYYYLGTDIYKLIIPTYEESQTYEFTTSDNGFLELAFMIGEDIGSFKIYDFKVVELQAEIQNDNVPGNYLASKLDWLRGNAVDGGSYIVTVNGNESINSGNWLGYGGKRVNITLTGGGSVFLNDVYVYDYMFNIDNNVTLILDNITLYGRSDNYYPLVYVNGTLIMNERAVITGNSCNWESSGVGVGEGGYFLMNGGTISNCVTSGASGGGVGIWRGTFEMRGGSINGNRGAGGVMVNENGIFNMYGGEISGNISNEWNNGGGVNVSNGTFRMEGGRIFKNTSNNGGGVNIGWYGTFTMSNGEINNNTSNNGGGGVYVSDNGTFTMTGGGISGNTASSGGGVSIGYNSTFTMIWGEISNNTVNGGNNRGGGVYVSSGTFNLRGGTISNNTTNVNSEGYYNYGGGGVYVSSGTFNMSGGTINGNTANGSYNSNYFGGGGVYIYDGAFTMSGGTVSGNTVYAYDYYDDGYYYDFGGGGVFIYNGTFTKLGGGTIYGYTNNDPYNTSWNIVKTNYDEIPSGRGHAVYWLYSNHVSDDTLDEDDDI